MLRIILIWLVMLVIAVGNGALRELTYGRAHQLSTLIGSIAMGVFVWFVIATWPPASGSAAIGVGLIWLGLTVAFETFMGLVLQKRPLASVLAEYNLRAGRVWALFLLWLAVAPWLFLWLKRG